MSGEGNTGEVKRSRLRAFLSYRRKQDRPPRFSTILRLVAEEAEERIRLSTLVDAFEGRGFGALMFILAAPNVLPLPPGTSSVLGLPLILIVAQLALGKRRLWLPQVIASRTIDRGDFRSLMTRARPTLRRVERYLAPRLAILTGPLGERLIGIACLLLSIILFLPVPLGNMLPGLAISLFSLALLQRDGLAALAGWVATAASIAVLGAVSGALLAAVRAFFHALGVPI